MASQFQNRLIGSVILVSLGVIFLPDILTGKPKTPTVPVAAIPMQPDAAPLPRPEAVNDAPPPVAAHPSSAEQTETWQMEEVAEPVTLNGREPDANQVVPAGTVVAAQPPQPVKPQPVAAKPVAAKPVEIKPQPAQPVAVKPPVSKPVQSQPISVKPQPVSPTPKPVAESANPVVQAKPAYEIKPFVPDSKPVTPAKPVNATPAATASVSGSSRSSGGVEVVEAQPTLSKPAVTSVTRQPAVTSPNVVAAGGSWIIQLGVFQSADNARALVGRLRAAGYPAGIQLVNRPQGLLHRVVVGPDVSRARLETMLPKVNQVGGTAGKIIAYSPAG